MEKLHSILAWIRWTIQLFVSSTLCGVSAISILLGAYLKLWEICAIGSVMGLLGVVGVILCYRGRVCD